jgi:hypothetical protein
MVKIRKHKLSKKVRERQEKKKVISKEIIITIIIAGVMILSVFGIMFSSYNDQTQKETYNGLDFFNTVEGWMTKIDGQKVYFSYAPSQLETLEVSPQVISLLVSQ